MRRETNATTKGIEMYQRILFPTQAETDTAPYEIFLPLTPNELKSMGAKSNRQQINQRRAIADFVASLPGFVKFYDGNQWIDDLSLGCLAMFANTTFAASAVLDIECKFGAIVGNGGIERDASTKTRLDAAIIAYKHTPSEQHFARLQCAMLDYQNDFYANKR